jgi:hypothetical protein
MPMLKTLVLSMSMLLGLAACHDHADEPEEQQSTGDEIKQEAREVGNDVDEATDEAKEDVDEAADEAKD